MGSGNQKRGGNKGHGKSFKMTRKKIQVFSNLYQNFTALDLYIVSLRQSVWLKRFQVFGLPGNKPVFHYFLDFGSILILLLA